tara:strand:+ start:541 stop:807 length:267 start_codon:yes stop_codon:yes gene_type:complete
MSIPKGKPKKKSLLKSSSKTEEKSPTDYVEMAENFIGKDGTLSRAYLMRMFKSYRSETGSNRSAYRMMYKELSSHGRGMAPSRQMGDW